MVHVYSPRPPEIGRVAVSQVRGYKTPISGFMGSWQRNRALNKDPGLVCQQFDDLTVERVKLQADQDDQQGLLWPRVPNCS